MEMRKGCCRMDHAGCSACSMGVSVEEYCKTHPTDRGCEDREEST